MLRPLYYLCKVFGLASYSYVADRRNKRVTTDYGYLNYMFTAIWLIVYTVGLPVELLRLDHEDIDSQILFITFMVYIISSYTSSIVAIVCISIIKRRKFLEILENISEVDNKLRYTVQEETFMNRKVMFNTISEIIFLIVVMSMVIIKNIYVYKSEPYDIIIQEAISSFPEFCNALILFQFVNLIFMVKQRYSHLNKRLTNWINFALSRPIYLNTENVRFSQSDRRVDQVNKTSLFVSRYGNMEGTLKQTDIHVLRQIYSELYDITCLINDTYGIPILSATCWILTGVLFCVYESLINFKERGGEDITYVLAVMVLFFNVTLFCHTATNEARSSRILVEKLLLERNCRNEIVEELKMLSFQLQAMTNEYTACGFFPLNLSSFISVVSVIVSYIVILVQIK